MIISRYLKILISYYFKKPIFPPNSVSFAITNRCNLKCCMCNYWKQIKDDKIELSKEEIKSFLSDLRRLKVNKIQITGGEPLLRKDLFDVLAFAKSLGFCISLVTNGTLIDESNAEELLKYIDSVYVSLDSPYEEVHEQIRGVKGSFNKTVSGLRLLADKKNHAKLKNSITVCSTITMKSLHNPLDMVKLLKDISVDRLIYNPASSGDYGYTTLKNDFDSDNNLLASYEKMVDEILALMYKGNRLLKSNPFYLEASKNFLKNDRKYIDLPCYSGGYDGLLVNFDGEVFPCCIWGRSMGNIKNSRFSDIWKSQSAQELRKLIKQRKCPMCTHQSRTFDYLFHAPLLIKRPLNLLKGYGILIKL